MSGLPSDWSEDREIFPSVLVSRILEAACCPCPCSWRLSLKSLFWLLCIFSRGSRQGWGLHSRGLLVGHAQTLQAQSLTESQDPSTLYTSLYILYSFLPFPTTAFSTGAYFGSLIEEWSFHGEHLPRHHLGASIWQG